MSRKDRRTGGSAPAMGGGPGARTADRLFDLAVAHHRSGQLAEAESLYRDSLSLDPNHADSLNCLGILAHQCGRNDAALELIGRAIGLQERNPQFHYNVALVLAASGRMDDAVAHNRRAIALKPDYTDAHTNLASALASQGKWSEAEVHFRRTLSQSPQSPLAYSNLAGALQAQGQPDEALGILARGIAAAENDDLKALFALCLQEQRSVPKVDRLRILVERAIVEGWARPSDLANFAIVLIKQSDTIRNALARPEDGQTAALSQELSGARGLAALAGDHLLQTLLTETPVCDPELERLLTNARHAALDLATSSNKSAVSDDVLKACGALAEQCFISDYAFDAQTEMDRVKALHDEIVAALAAKTPLAPIALATLACYIPLHSVVGAPALAEQSWPDPVLRVVTQQVREPAQEQQLRSSISTLTSAGAPQPLTESGPSPRWVKPAMLSRPMLFDEYIRIQFPHLSVQPLGKDETDILVAGCGSGRNAVEMARWCMGARILAVDPDLANLSYALRKSDELKVLNIEFGQADLSSIDSLGRMFDVIEAVAASPHLADPAAGWRHLASLLRPGGFMHLALPRAAAHESIRAARSFAAARGRGPQGDDVRLARQEILALEADAPARAIARYSDFFTIGELRELLFPAHETAGTIADIKAGLTAANLNFAGFNDTPYGEYAKRFPDDRAMSDLDKWEAVENENPAVFGAVYQFWVQKPAEAAPAPA
jgi:tetratricopeptide (TPR) repeat protein/2-polyprenyl-3-methyl-5-hydroxy-6-metoxy-1,4-benzoquinol methylase